MRKLTRVQAAEHCSSSKRSKNKVCPTNCCHFRPQYSYSREISSKVFMYVAQYVAQDHDNFRAVPWYLAFLIHESSIRFLTIDEDMGRWSKVADFLQKSITFTCMAGTVYLLVITGRNYLALREKRLANAALIEGAKDMKYGSSESVVVPPQEQVTFEVSFRAN